MATVELVRGFLVDLWHLPLVFKLFLLYGAGAAGWKWWKGKQHAELVAESETWPVYRARVVFAQVLDRKGGGEDGPSYWEGLLTYSYTVPGHELEIGEHRKRFADEEEADEWARGLRETFVDVRVDPRDPKRSVWQETAILTTRLLRAPVMDAMRSKEVTPWGQRELAAAAVFCAAASGTLYASWIQLSCLTGRPLITAETNTKIFFGMHFGAIICAIASSMLAAKNHTANRWSAWRDSISKGSSDSLLLKIMGAYFTVVFTYGWVRMAAHDGEPSNWGILMFSAGWVLFYLTAAITSWRTMNGSEGNAT